MRHYIASRHSLGAQQAVSWHTSGQRTVKRKAQKLVRRASATTCDDVPRRSQISADKVRTVFLIPRTLIRHPAHPAQPSSEIAKLARVLRQRYPFRSPDVQVDQLVIGAGVVGLAVAERLVKALPDRTTFLVERNAPPAGQETSSRNSEVIHSGAYYPLDSLKTRLCVRGRDLIYQRPNVRSKKTGKLILATSNSQRDYLRQLVDKCSRIPPSMGKVPLKLISGDEAREMEPDVSTSVVAAIHSTETGIVDSHGLMDDLEQVINDSDTGELVYGTRVVRIDRAELPRGSKRGDGTENGWIVQTVSSSGDADGEGEVSAVQARTVINCAGLNAHHILNQILPEEQSVLHFAKGSYWSYRGPGVSNIKRLLYPCPDPKALAGLGTHLTLNMDNEIRFGPDVEWLEPDRDEHGLEKEPDFWRRHLAPSDVHLEAAVESVKSWLPGVEASGFSPDYSGIRPKLTAKGVTAADFSITHPAPGFISLNGIESPGLTSALAIGEYVEQMVKNEVLGLHSRGGGRKVSEAGQLDAWA